MLKNRQSEPTLDKKGSTKEPYLGPLASGLNRRAFLRTSGAISLLGGLLACKPHVPELGINTEIQGVKSVEVAAKTFNASQLKLLDQVLMRLFPADGNGPSAQDINALGYLEWAMKDTQNIDDGDPDFIIKGLGWLQDLSLQTQGNEFQSLPIEQQSMVLTQIANSQTGENWMSLLIYYLTEALLLDPIYGGNTNQAGWNWLQHQAGFPRPVLGKTYRDFQ